MPAPNGEGPTPNTLNRPLSAIEAAEFLGVSPYTLKDWRARGVGPRYFYASPAKRNPRYPPDELLTFQHERLNGIETFLDERQRLNGEDASPPPRKRLNGGDA